MYLPNEDRSILRNLARRQYEYSQLPGMAERRRMWTDHNDLKGQKPPIHVELWTFQDDLIPELRCRSDAGRAMEHVILSHITNHERIGDDRVVYDFFPVGWKTWFRLFDLTVKRNAPEEKSVGHQFIHHIKDFPTDFDVLGPSTWGVDRKETQAWTDLVNETIGDILPARMTMGSLEVSLSQKVVHLMGMEAMIFAMVDFPDKFHEFMGRITDDHIAYFRWLEAEELLVLNNSDNDLGQGSFGYCTELPRRTIAPGEPVLTTDLWAMMESQETVSISPEMFDEYFRPYYLRASENFGMISYGCCEPVDALWENCISRFPNVRKVSVSPWCNEEKMGDYLKGSQTIYHRKPSPNFMGVDKVFDEQGFRAHFRKTLNAARGCKLEISYRDVYTLCGDPDRPRKMVGIMREMIEDHWQG